MLKIGIVGLGSMGKNHYRILKGFRDADVSALCDTVVNDNFEEKMYRNIDEFLLKEELDAVIVSVPTFLHKEVAIKCIEKNINVFIEKPAASTVTEANEIIKAIDKYKVKAVVGHIERFNPVVKQLKKELENKEIYSISITRVGPIPPRISDVGVLTDLSVHDIDLIRFISKKNILNKSIYKSKKIHNHYEDNAVLSFNLENDIVANITTNWLTPFKKRKIEVATKDAYYEADLMNQDLTEYSSLHIDRGDHSYVVRNCFVKKGEPLIYEMSAFVNYIKGEAVNDFATVEDSIKTLEILESV